MKKIKLTSIICVLLIFVSCKKEIKNDNIKSNITEKLIPPLPKLNIPYSNFSINNLEDTIINHKNGTKIFIPKNAFLDSKGNLINKEVSLKFRTFNNPLETYLAGIPMNYNINGEEKVFESAGMFEITANHKGEKLFVNPENKIQVSLNSYNEDSNFYTYDLNKENNKWIETGKDSIRIESKKEDLNKLPKLPVAPKKAGKFSFEIENELYPEISDYKNVWFTPVNGKPCGYDAKDIKITNLKNGTYKVEFIPWVEMEGLNSVCICYLSFKDDLEYSKALKKYQKKYKSLIEREKKKKEKIEKEWNLYQKQIIDYNVFLTRVEIEKLSGERKIIRSLEVSNFGFVNCDRPINFPQGAKIKPIYLNDSGEKIELKQVVLIERGKNALYRYKDSIKFNPKNDNLLWGITKNDKLAYFTNEDFNALKIKNGKVNLKMNIHSKELKTYDEIINVLFN